MSAGLINVQFCIFLPAIATPHVAPLIQLPLHPPLAPISECGTMSYGMALQCAETAEVMDTDRMFTASCDECKWDGLPAVGSWAEPCVILSAPPFETPGRAGILLMSPKYVGQHPAFRRGQRSFWGSQSPRSSQKQKEGFSLPFLRAPSVPPSFFLQCGACGKETPAVCVGLT